MNQDAERVLARLVDVEKADTSGIESRHRYREMHERRFAQILRVCRSLAPNSSARILDVGRSELTAYLSTFYRNVHTLGLDPHTDDGGHRETRELNAIPRRSTTVSVGSLFPNRVAQGCTVYTQTSLIRVRTGLRLITIAFGSVHRPSLDPSQSRRDRF